MSKAQPPGDVDDVKAVFESYDDPVLTTREVGDALDVSRRTALRKLQALEEAGIVTRKEVGPRGAVWWLIDDSDTNPDYLKGFGSASGTDFREAVEEAGDEIDDDFEGRQHDLFGN